MTDPGAMAKPDPDVDRVQLTLNHMRHNVPGGAPHNDAAIAKGLLTSAEAELCRGMATHTLQWHGLANLLPPEHHDALSKLLGAYDEIDVTSDYIALATGIRWPGTERHVHSFAQVYTWKCIATRSQHALLPNVAANFQTQFAYGDEHQYLRVRTDYKDGRILSQESYVVLITLSQTVGFEKWYMYDAEIFTVDDPHLWALLNRGYEEIVYDSGVARRMFYTAAQIVPLPPPCDSYVLK